MFTNEEAHSPDFKSLLGQKHDSGHEISEISKQYEKSEGSTLNFYPSSFIDDHDSGSLEGTSERISKEIDENGINESNYAAKFVSSLSQVLLNLSPQELVQMAERIVQRWQISQEENYNRKMKKLISTYEKAHFREEMVQTARAFYKFTTSNKKSTRNAPIKSCKEGLSITNKYSQNSSMTSTRNLSKAGTDHIPSYKTKRIVVSPSQMVDPQDYSALNKKYYSNKSNKGAIQSTKHKYTPKKHNFLAVNKSGAYNKDKLEELGITHILSLGNEFEEEFKDSYTYKIFGLDDDEDNDVKQFFKEGIAFIEKCLQDKGTILVHCAADNKSECKRSRRSSKNQQLSSERLSKPKRFHQPKIIMSKAQEEKMNCTFTPNISVSQT